MTLTMPALKLFKIKSKPCLLRCNDTLEAFWEFHHLIVTLIIHVLMCNLTRGGNLSANSTLSWASNKKAETRQIN